MKNIFKKIVPVFIIFSMMILQSCSEKQVSENVWVVGTSADNPPYEFIENGEVVGFDIDYIKAIGHHLGYEVEIKNMEFHSLLAALSSGNVDMVVAGMSITPERKERVDFSHPYSVANIAILHRGADYFPDIDALKGKKIAGQLGSIFSIIAQQLASDADTVGNALSSNLLLVEELKNKRLDAVVLEKSQAEKFVTQHQSLGYFDVPKYGTSFAIAFPKGSKIKGNIDHTIKTLKNNGITEKLEKKWNIK